MNRRACPAIWILALALVGSGCSKDSAAPAPASPGPGGVETNAPSTPSAPASPMDAARKQLAMDLSGDSSLDTLLDAAASAREWASAQTDGATTGEALLLAARLELTAIGAAAARDGAKRATSAGTQQFEDSLRAMAKLPETLGSAHPQYDAARRAAEAGLVALSTNPNVKDVALDLGSARELALSATHEGLIIRAVWMSRIESALAALAGDPPELHVGTVVPLIGRLLCSRCADAHHITPDKVTHFLLNPSNSGGMVCDTALQVGRTAKTPPMEIAAMSACEGLRLSKGAAEPTLLWSTNAILVGALHLAVELAAAPAGESNMSPLIAVQATRLTEALAKPVRLPVLIPSAPIADGDLEASWNGALEGMATGGQSVSAPADAVFYVGPGAVRAGLRPTVAIASAGLVSLSARHGLPAGGKDVMSADALKKAEVSSETGILAISSALAELREAIPRVGGDPKGPVELVIDSRVDAQSTAKVLDALRVAGVHHVRFAKTATHGRTFPVLVRDETPGLRSRFGDALERPLLAVVSGTNVDVWLPRSARGKKQGDLAKLARGLRDDVRVGYRGKKLARLRVPLGLDGATGVGASGAKALEGIFRAAADRTDAGPVLHVIARKGARAADVLSVASIFQERQGRALNKPEEIWPGTACGGRAYARTKQTPKGCATAVAVAFSSKNPPSNAGISEGPAKTEAAPAKPKKAAAGFCEKKNISVQMKKRRGSFRFCYERELRMNKDLAGRVTMRFQIGANGAVKGSPQVVTSSLGSKPLHQCLAKNIKKITFAKPDGGTCSVRWPFVFKAK